MTRRTRLRVALGLTGALVVSELAAGLVARSAGLLSDAGHNLADVAAIMISLTALRWAARPRSDARSYGNHRATILAALANAAILAAITVALGVLGVARLVHPVRVDGPVVAAVAGAVLVVNGAAAIVLADHGGDLNLRSVSAHLLGDVAASAAVLVGGLAIMLGGPAADRADAAASIAVAAIILVQAVRILRESTDVLFESTPPDVDVPALRAAVTAVPGVDEVHDLHVWSLSSDYRALSAHLVLSGHPSLEEAQAIGALVRTRVSTRFDIAHTTFEMECERCDDTSPDPCASGTLPLDEHHGDVHHGDERRRDERRGEPGQPAHATTRARTRGGPE